MQTQIERPPSTQPNQEHRVNINSANNEERTFNTMNHQATLTIPVE